MKLLLLILLSLLTTPNEARASLGDDLKSVEQDRVIFSAHLKTVAKVHPLYTSQEISNDGMTIREYANLSGTIFAVTWFGTNQPDLGPLLGRYFSQFQTALKKSRSVQLRVRTPRVSYAGEDVVVEKSGHMRAARGRAYLSKMIPEGVDVHALQ